MVADFTSETRLRWQRRRDRAQELSKRASSAIAPLSFYQRVLAFQGEVARQCKIQFDHSTPLRRQIDLTFVDARMDDALVLAREDGPALLAERAGILMQANEASRKQLIESCIFGQSDSNPLDDFFIRACIQPIAEKLQMQIPPDAHYVKNTCPACGGLPQLSILRPEGEGASRSLLCSFCLREWVFRRIICPSCGEEEKGKLPRYSAPECGHVSVEACESCKKYLKSVDMTVDGHAEPLVDEAAVAALDLWATERGYSKIIGNLMGF